MHSLDKVTLLAILQQSEYDLAKLNSWAQDPSHAHHRLLPEKWTSKLRIIDWVSSVCFFLPPITAIKLGLFIVSFPEALIRNLYYLAAKIKLWLYRKQGLKVITIAGSFAKTSTKHILQETLNHFTPTLMTPLSINTQLGIAQVILKDLKPHHKVLIVELGEYHFYDIPQLTAFVAPDLGILTPLGRQHLEQLGSFENVIKTFQSYVDFFTRRPRSLLMADTNRQYFSLETPSYGYDSTNTIFLSNTQVTRAGTEFSVQQQNGAERQSYSGFIPLFGEHQAFNCLPSLWVGQQLQLEPAALVKKWHSLSYITRRHQPTFAEHNVLILDNSYNTNVDSVKESLKLLNQLQATLRFLITLGFTELGSESKRIHEEFGKSLVGQVDYIGLIEAPWTDDITRGFVAAGGKRAQIVTGTSQEEAFQKLQQFVIPGSVILFEGGYREVYI